MDRSAVPQGRIWELLDKNKVGGPAGSVRMSLKSIHDQKYLFEIIEKKMSLFIFQK